MTPRRVMILGGPGSGKSTLARALAARLAVPAVHLDRLYHRPGWVPAPAAEFAAAVERAAALPEWVIDGNYSRTAAVRLARAGLIVFLDMPRRLALLRVCRRILRYHGRERPDAAPGCPERIDPAFLRYVWRWRRDVRPRVMAICDAFDGPVTVLRNPRDVAAFLAAVDATTALAPPPSRD